MTWAYFFFQTDFISIIVVATPAASQMDLRRPVMIYTVHTPSKRPESG